jgi:hypothetical protein
MVWIGAGIETAMNKFNRKLAADNNSELDK